MNINLIKNVLIVGGTSGLGLEIAKSLKNFNVIITGRTNPNMGHLTFIPLSLDRVHEPDSKLDEFVMALPPIDLFIYAAGFYQEGRIDELTDIDILSMLNVGLTAPVFLLQRLLLRQSRLEGFIAITSTSQWTPRRDEPVYTAVKAGLGMLANSMAEDNRVGQVLVAGPAGMHTPFWDSVARDTRGMLDPRWVAHQIVSKFFSTDHRYSFVQILRDSPRIKLADFRD